jgi:hypothetical protein
MASTTSPALVPADARLAGDCSVCDSTLYRFYAGGLVDAAGVAHRHAEYFAPIPAMDLARARRAYASVVARRAVRRGHTRRA